MLVPIGLLPRIVYLYHPNKRKSSMDQLPQCNIIVSEWKQDHEEIREIPDSLNWTTYAAQWRPTWQLRSTQILDQHLQPIQYPNTLVPEVRIRPTSAINVPDAVYQLSLQKSNEATHALTTSFHDVSFIWEQSSAERGIEHRYFSIHRPRTLLQWPACNSDFIFPQTTYNYVQYKQLWWNLLWKDNLSRSYFTMLKFGPVSQYLQGARPDWLQDWWLTFGLNKSAVDPANIEQEYNELNVSLEKICHLRERQVMDERHMLDVFMAYNLQWLVRTKLIVQLFQQRPIIVGQVYTKMWDTSWHSTRFGWVTIEAD